MKTESPLGLVLTGGGARGAYQAGVLKALAIIAKGVDAEHAFKIVTGVSAGAINAVYWAAHAEDIVAGATKLAAIWENLTFDNVINANVFSMSRLGAKLLFDMSSAPVTGSHLSHSLLDTAPLAKLLRETLPFDRIATNIAAGHLDAVAVTATDYASSTSTTFMECLDSIEDWERKMRASKRTKLSADHVLASSAIPVFFAPAKIDGLYFGDGSLRNNTPLSPAIHMGADKLFVIGVRKHPYSSEVDRPNTQPSLGRVLSVVLNAIMIDGLEADLERLYRINRTIDLVEKEKRDSLGLRTVQVLTIHPTEDLSVIARDYTSRLPRMIRFFIKGLGPINEAASMVSYLLFDKGFCGELVRLGFEDAMRQRTEIEAFISASCLR